MIPYGRQSIRQPDIDAVSEVLTSGYLTTGPAVAEFESALADFLGAKHVVAVNNGTSALQLAMHVSGIGPGDKVITTPITFLASANAAAYLGATPDFADVGPETITLSPDALEEAWDEQTKAVVAVDLAGQPADYPRISKIAKEHDGVVIADGCHSLGGKFEQGGEEFALGSHPFADITTLSFHPVKTLTTGEGGALVTENDDFAAKARELRHHGMVRGPENLVGLGLENEEFGPWYYEMQDLGYNHRITDFQCALGTSQVSRLGEFIVRRREIVAAYNEAFAELPNTRLPVAKWPALTSWHLYVLQIDFAELGKTRTAVMEELRAKSIGTQVHYIPVYLQPWYRKTYGYGPGKCPNAEAYYQKCLSLPLYPEMSDSDVSTVIDAVREVIA